MTAPAPTAMAAALRALAWSSEIATAYPGSLPVVCAAVGPHGNASVNFGSVLRMEHLPDPFDLFAALPHDPSKIERAEPWEGAVQYDWMRRDGFRVSARIATDLDAEFRRRARAEAGVTLPGGDGAEESGPEPARDEAPVKSRSVA